MLSITEVDKEEINLSTEKGKKKFYQKGKKERKVKKMDPLHLIKRIGAIQLCMAWVYYMCLLFRKM